MIYHENRLLADNFHKISYLIFSKIKMSQNLSSAAGALRVNQGHTDYTVLPISGQSSCAVSLFIWIHRPPDKSM